jgi:hypothetical protein
VQGFTFCYPIGCTIGFIQFSGSEWICSTPFDASLLTPEPPPGGSFFLPCAGNLIAVGQASFSATVAAMAVIGGLREEKMCISFVGATPQSQINAHKHSMLTVACQCSMQ